MPPASRAARTRALSAAGALALLVLALVLRLPRGDLAEWKGDEAVEFALARAVAREGARPRGIPSTEGPRTPIHSLYTFASAVVLADDPESCRVLVALLASGGVVLVFLGGRRSFGARPSLAAGLALATLPTLVRWGRWAWFPNLVAPIAALHLLALVRTVREPRGKAAGALLALSTLLAFVHYSTLGVVALGVAATAWAWTRGADRRALGLGALVSLALATPFLAGELGSRFETTRSVLAVAAHGGRASQTQDAPERGRLAFAGEVLGALDLEAFARALGTEAHEGEPRLSGERAVRAVGPPRPLLLGVEGALVLLVLAGAALGARELARSLASREPPGSAGVALALVLAAWGPFFVLRLPAREHYVQDVLPAVAVLAGVALGAVARRGRGGAALAASLLLALGVAGTLEVDAVLRSLDAGGAQPRSAYELPFRDKKAACELLLDRELELARYRHFEDVVLLETCYRELARRDPERARRFEVVAIRERYWELDLAVPRPKAPEHGRAELVDAPAAGLVENEIGRCGAIVVKKLP